MQTVLKIMILLTLSLPTLAALVPAVSFIPDSLFKPLNFKGENSSITVNRCELLAVSAGLQRYRHISDLETVKRTNATTLNLFFEAPIKGLTLTFPSRSQTSQWIKDLEAVQDLCKKYQQYWDHSFQKGRETGLVQYVSGNACNRRFDPVQLAPIEELLQSIRVTGPAAGIPMSLKRDGVFPIRQADHELTFMDGPESFRKRLAMIKKAEGPGSVVYIQTFEFMADRSINTVVEELIAAKRRGVDVQIYKSSTPLMVEPQGIPEHNKLYRRLMAHGIPVHGFYCGLRKLLTHQAKYSIKATGKPTKAYGNGIHEKIMVTSSPQGEEAILGGMNMAEGYFRVTTPPESVPFLERYQDHDVHISSPSLTQDVRRAFIENVTHFSRERGDPRLQQCFNPYPAGTAQFSRFAEENGGPAPKASDLVTAAELHPLEVTPPTYTSEAARVIRSRPEHGETHIDEFYHQAIEQATSEIWLITPYFVPPESMVQAIQRAVQRGVRVNIMATGSKARFHDNQLAKVSRRYFFNLMAQNPEMVRIYEFDGITETPESFRARGLNHAKMMFVDDRLAFVGSFNLDNISRHVNTEIGLAFVSPEIISYYKRRFLLSQRDLWSREVSLEDAIRYQHESSVVGKALFQIKGHL